MTGHIPIEDLIDSAERMLSGILSCAKDNKKFLKYIKQFDIWMIENKEKFVKAKDVNINQNSKIKVILHKIMIIEKIINTNVSISDDMHAYLVEKSS
tara:strand:+ start:67 stop:357 length:291 start_codon:yes stop_codon:yes gene_type:complete